MPDPGGFPLAELLNSLGSVVVVVFVAALLLVLWQLVILLGALIANVSRRGEEHHNGEVRVG